MRATAKQTRASAHPREGGSSIAVEGLVKRYPRAAGNAVDGLSFTVARGEALGLLGPNGAGKSTTVGILTTRIRPTSGTATIAGVDVVGDPVTAHTRFGVVPQRNNLDRSLSCRQNLAFHAAYHGVPRAVRRLRAAALLERFGLTDKAESRIESLSGGEAQRVMIARALMHRPEALFLDEPTTGLDPAARLFVWDRVRELKAAGVAILLCTHDMDEAAALADRVAIVDHGRLLALERPAALVRSLPGGAALEVGITAATGGSSAILWTTLENLPGVNHVEPLGSSDGVLRGRLYLTGEAARLVAPVAKAALGHGTRLSEVALMEPSLEDVFIHLTGRRLR